MKTWIALLRGINVGGRNALPMPALVDRFEGLGLSRVRTHIQSGNAVFHGPDDEPAALATRIADAIETGHGFRPRVMLLTADELEGAVIGNPFPDAEAEPNKLHLFFLERPAGAADRAGLDAAATASERYVLAERVLYLHAPDGFGRSKLAERAERLLGVPVTARNWRTVHALADMARDV
ncbi:MAG: DUF1697 domain-containing protein [Inquilinus sp.]|nr:DUF1697 domain-containing protein [Inquilinus sp.]